MCSVCHAVSMSLLDRLVWGLYNKGHLYVSINLQIRERLETNPVNAVALHAITSAWSPVCLVVVCKSAGPTSCIIESVCGYVNGVWV